jgi:hypothetical protein
MSLLAFLELRYPVRMLPSLLFDIASKMLWIAVIAIPAWSDDMNAATRQVLFSCFFVVIIMAVIPGIRLEALRQDARSNRLSEEDRTRSARST